VAIAEKSFVNDVADTVGTVAELLELLGLPEEEPPLLQAASKARIAAPHIIRMSASSGRVPYFPFYAGAAAADRPIVRPCLVNVGGFDTFASSAREP